MPELPEVETIRRTLLPRIVGARIIACDLRRRDILVAPGDPAGGFSRQRTRIKSTPAPLIPADLLEGSVIDDVLRRGKQLALVGRPTKRDPARALVVQLGMSGQLFMDTDPPTPSTHVHAVWTVQSTGKPRTRNWSLIFRDPRRFGGLRIFRTLADLETHWSALGPDGLDLTASDLHRATRDSARPIKALLLDQCAVAGIGNIYADEALFRAGIRPSRRADRLKESQTALLAAAIRGVLAEAVEARGSTLRDYRDAEGREGGFRVRHAVYGRGGKPCTRCGTKLREAVLGQRTTVWCPRCQQ